MPTDIKHKSEWMKAYYIRNKERLCKQAATWRKSHPVESRSSYLSRKYGIDHATYEQMLKAQNGLCAICKNPETVTNAGKVKLLAVDHCHKTGAVRQLLCQMCNTAIGKLRDDIKIVKAALDYLVNHSTPDSKNRDSE